VYVFDGSSAKRLRRRWKIKGKMVRSSVQSKPETLGRRPHMMSALGVVFVFVFASKLWLFEDRLDILSYSLHCIRISIVRLSL